MSNNQYFDQILSSWEQTFQKGQLTFWILISLKDSSKSVEEIKSFISSFTNDIICYDEQSIYRAIRRYHNIELVDFEMKDGNRGPQRKCFSLTELGHNVLNTFIQRNIEIFQSKELIELTNKH